MTAPRSMLGAIYAVRPPSGVARGAELGMELGSLVPQQAACSVAREVPAAPVIVVEPGTLSQQAGRDRAPRGGVEAGGSPPPEPRRRRAARPPGPPPRREPRRGARHGR